MTNRNGFQGHFNFAHFGGANVNILNGQRGTKLMANGGFNQGHISPQTLSTRHMRDAVHRGAAF